ncbi:hypothetical protein DMENIID0001_068120 [Sergentomyia squamirostris]
MEKAYKVVGKLETRNNQVSVSVKKAQVGQIKVKNEKDKYVITNIEAGPSSKSPGRRPVTRSSHTKTPPRSPLKSTPEKKVPETKKFFKSPQKSPISQVKKKFFCFVCNIEFKMKNLLLAHLSEVHKVSLYKCDFCDEKFVTASILEKHIDSIHVRFPTKYSEVKKEEHIDEEEEGDQDYDAEPPEEIDWLHDDDHDYQNTVLENIKVEESEVSVTSNSLKRKRDSFSNSNLNTGDFDSPGPSSIKEENFTEFEIEVLEDEEDDDEINERNMWWAIPKKVKAPSKSSVDRSRMCHICGEMKAHLLSHIEKVHQEFKHCSSCNQKIPNLGKGTHHCNRRRIIHRCTCGLEYDIKEHLIGHILEQNSTNHEIQCPQCIASFSEFSEYTQHMENVHPHPFSCGVCAKRFAKKENLKSHIYAVHVLRKTVEKCEVCGAECRGKRNLKRHINYVHQKSTRINCEICNASCFDRPSLKRHMVFKHGAPKEFACDVCKKEFATQDALRYHLTIHTGERNYPCPFCPKAFKINSELRKHYRAHKDLTVKCPSCSMYCLNDDDLRAHLRRFPLHDSRFAPE